MLTLWRNAISIPKIYQVDRKEDYLLPSHSLENQRLLYWINQLQVWIHQREDISGIY